MLHCIHNDKYLCVDCGDYISDDETVEGRDESREKDEGLYDWELIEDDGHPCPPCEFYLKNGVYPITQYINGELE